MQEFFSNIQGTQDLAARLIVEELYRLDITQYAVAPGARMLPLLDAISAHPKTTVQLFNDERQAAFWAQAAAHNSKQPVVIVVTSGTALGNLVPGVMEAYYSEVPVILITCDRPWELQHAKANQTVKQVDFFSQFTKQSINIPAISEDLVAEALLANIDQLVATAKSLPAGPVHLNLAFRKPYLNPDFNWEQLGEHQNKTIARWDQRKRPFRTFVPEKPVADYVYIEQLVTDVNLSKKPLIVAGPLKSAAEAEALLALTQKIKAPIIADIDSGLRGRANVSSLYNLYLANLSAEYQPDIVLYLGGRIVSENLRRYLTEQDCPKYLLTDYDQRQDVVENESLHFDYHFFVSLPEFLAAFAYKVEGNIAGDYCKLWSKKEQQASVDLTTEFADSQEEAALVAAVCQKLPKGSLLYHSSSLIFRELEYFAEFPHAPISVQSNRGCVGIDGVLASAVGASKSYLKTFLVIGDQALKHDLSSLMLTPAENFHIIVINNQGGAVFNLLEYESIRPLLVNSNDLNFTKIGEAFSLDFASITNLKELDIRFNQILNQTTSSLTEIRTAGPAASQFFKKYQT